MQLLKKTNLIFTLMSVGYLFFSIVPAAWGFNGRGAWKIIDLLGQERRQFSILMDKIEKQQWTIGLRYSVDCPAEFREKEAELKEMIVECLRAWLKPIRDLKPGLPITDDFRFVRHKDFSGNLVDDGAVRFAEMQAVDVGITFEFKRRHPFAVTGFTSPEVYMRDANMINTNKRRFFYFMMHEFGHTFGLADIYTIDHPARQSTGGWADTIGMQPTSLMAANAFLEDPSGYPCEDDARGIQWMYKHIYEGLARDDCFFSDYVFEEETVMKGCRPKYPFIFEIKHLCTLSHFVTDMLDQDPMIDVNERDDEGLTALHYAVMREDAVIVKNLLDREDIKPFLRDKRGRTAIKLAQAAELRNIVALLLTHPLTSRIDFSQTLATTWGHLKIEQ